jgi:hypothetical protein
MLGLASVTFLLFNSLAPPAFAQSAKNEKIEAALLSLQHESPATLQKITPELLGLQKELANTLNTRVEGLREEFRIGQRTVEDVASAVEVYFRELETLKVMAARASKKSVSEGELLSIRIETRSTALSYLREFLRQTEDRFTIGEVTPSDVAVMRARSLKAEIMLKALQGAAAK